MGMGFRVGFFAGCAVGVWAAVKAVQLQRLGAQPSDRRSASASSRASAVGADVTAEKLKAFGDLARERVTSLVSDRGTATHDRIVSLIGSSLLEDSDRAAAPGPLNGTRHSA